VKKIMTFFAGLFFLLITTNVNAQSKTGADYFAGKWSVLVKGTPNGDAKMFFVLKKNDAGLTGVVLDSTGKEMSKIDKVELSEKIAIFYFTAKSYDVSLSLTRKDDDHATGTLMDMFDASAVRVKDEEKK
jgi:hypothetical protein